MVHIYYRKPDVFRLVVIPGMLLAARTVLADDRTALIAFDKDSEVITLRIHMDNTNL